MHLTNRFQITERCDVMEGWKLIYKVLLAVVLVYALYNVYIISNLRHSEEEEKLKKSQELLQSELGQIESHLRQLETNQNEFSSVVKDVQEYIQVHRGRVTRYRSIFSNDCVKNHENRVHNVDRKKIL